MENSTQYKVLIIKNIYLYLVSFITLLMIILPAADLLNIGLKKTIFTKAEYYGGPGDEPYRTAELHRSLARDIGYLAVGLPIFLLHLNLTRKKENI